MVPAAGPDHLTPSIEWSVVELTIHTQVQREKARGAACVLTRQHEVIAFGMHDLATNAGAVFMKQPHQPAWANVGGDYAVYVGPDPPRITFIAVQHTVRYVGTIEDFEHTQHEPSGTAALLNVHRRRR